MKVRWAVAVLVVLLGAAAWLLSSGEPAPTAAPAPTADPSVQPEPFGFARDRLRRGVTAEPSPSPIAAAPPVPQLAARTLASAQTTVQTQLTFLGDNQYDLFQQTFTEALRPQVTREVFDACRVRVTQLPVLPDWEVAEASTSDAGRRVLAVSMFGKSMTPFEEVDGRWLAGALWCVPVGLP